MRMTRVIAILIALTAAMCGHAKSAQSTDVNARDLDCLAKNIYYEAASEPEEGKVAVAMVTINRVRDGRFGKSICSVVDQRTVQVKSIERTETKMVQAGFFGTPEQRTTKTVTMQNVTICQFSWRCMFVRKPKDADERWQTSQEVAQRQVVLRDLGRVRHGQVFAAGIVHAPLELRAPTGQMLQVVVAVAEHLPLVLLLPHAFVEVGRVAVDPGDVEFERAQDVLHSPLAFTSQRATTHRGIIWQILEHPTPGLDALGGVQFVE